ncbi:MAG: prolyl oligopeptidase family serine peptidase, partial [Clostridiales bacterium]|nr:prolyl oligopeptidase family serine peptidase [Clostridiales bacterium]
MSITVNIAQAEKYNPGESYYNLDCKLWEHVLARADELHKAAKEARDSIRTCRELEEYAESKRSLFIKSLGGIPYDNTLPLEDKVMGFVDVPGMRIEKIIFKSRPHVYVTANLYLPHKRKNPCGAVLFQLGHAADGKAYEQYQRVARSIASAGLIVMTMDPIGQGERLSYYEPSLGQFIIGPTTQEHQYAGNQCLLAGDNIARYFVADAMRAIDYLISRPEVDPAKIGATGSSGGGTATSMMMICDNRIAAAAPGTFVTNYEEYIRTGNPQDAEQIWANSASDGINHNEILLCFAPKPVMLLTADTDFFTIEGTRDVFNNSM